MCVYFSHWFSISLAYSTIAFKDPHPLFIQSRCLFLTDFCLPSIRCCSSAPLKTKLLLAKQTPVCLLARSLAECRACGGPLDIAPSSPHSLLLGCRVTKMRDRESMHLLAKHLRLCVFHSLSGASCSLGTFTIPVVSH